MDKPLTGSNIQCSHVVEYLRRQNFCPQFAAHVQISHTEGCLCRSSLSKRTPFLVVNIGERENEFKFSTHQ